MQYFKADYGEGKCTPVILHVSVDLIVEDIHQTILIHAELHL